ncbi:prolyl oligopeptidase family serine peptidase [Amycolatopsis thermalba]|uniref:Prolyl oligopeptidase family serine peptidase n=1 Tax=Amycolatopsis thermalba TaxID=944492 RepID=A0ABY4P0B9_9PSEU|nr:prolyl oligopeptidase family serine peptidase [Amycolatopsis thermalba]UQS25789.1 prolyl oligopeptidase family serine peptidase [Amycolatopsis thermalba]
MTDDAFADLDAYVRLPRLSGLVLSPDGRRLVVGVATPDLKKNRYTTALWEVDPAGERPARRLTRSAEGESGAAFTPSGDLLFVSARPDAAAEGEDGPKSALWLQPASGGDARVVAAPAGGIHGVTVAAEAGTVLAGAPMMPSATSADHDAEVRKARKDAGVSAILHEEYPIRYWDHDLGPDGTRLVVADGVPAGEDRLELRDLTGHAGRALGDEASWDVAPDGRTVVTTWVVPEGRGSQRTTVVAIDVATGERRVLADDADHEYESPRISPDGTQVAIAVYRRSTPHAPGDYWLALVPLTGGEIRPLTREWDRWPHSPRWLPDGSALVVAADDQGRSPLWRVDATSGDVTRLTADDGAYTDPRISPDGRWVYALRSAVDHPPAPVRVALDGGAIEPLPGPAEALGLDADVPGRLDEVTATAEDGTPLRAWLALPRDAGPDSPAPLLLWIHGGPLGSWNAWQWRWNPWLAVAQGYAVLLPDPAISTGYGYEFIKRGWGAWGAAPFTDLMATTDAAERHPAVDETRTAAMGGSFGGYMANWVAGHTDRFRAIVTHASLWALDQFGPTTDATFYWQRELTPEMAEANSPHRFADEISTPMLVIHGDKDYRVPIGEGLRLWWDLASRSAAEDGSTPHKFLYFPDENHWILTPHHAKLWYATVFAFLAQHVLGKDWQRPELLG